MKKQIKADTRTPNSRPRRDIHLLNRNGRFHSRARNGLSVWDWPVYSRPLPHRHPFSDFFWGDGAAVHRLSEMDNPSSNRPSKLMDKVRRFVHSKLKLFHFQIKTYYLSDANHQTDNPSHMNNPSLVWKRPITKIPASSVFSDSEGLYRTTVCLCLVRRPQYFALLMRFASRCPSEFATEMPWLRLRGIKAVPELGMAMSTVASEKNRKLLFISSVFYKQ